MSSLVIIKNENGDCCIHDDSWLSMGVYAIIPNNPHIYGSGGIDRMAEVVARAIAAEHNCANVRFAHVRDKVEDICGIKVKLPVPETERWIIKDYKEVPNEDN